jgi:hypothetical protein
MIVPHLLVIVAADKCFASLVVGHLLCGALEVRNIVEEVKRKENHGCNQPLEGEDDEEQKLVSVLASNPAKKDLYLVFLSS